MHSEEENAVAFRIHKRSPDDDTPPWKIGNYAFAGGTVIEAWMRSTSRMALETEQISSGETCASQLPTANDVKLLLRY